MDTTNYQATQASFGTHSRPKFSAMGGDFDKRPVLPYVGDDRADWRFHEIEQERDPVRALALLKSVAPRLGFLQAEWRNGVGVFWNAIKRVGGRNGLAFGDEALMSTWAEISPLMQEARDLRAAELAIPFMDAARNAVLNQLKWHREKPRVYDREGLIGCVEDQARAVGFTTDIPANEIFDYLAEAAELTDEELNKLEWTEEDIAADLDDNFDAYVDIAIGKGEPADRASILERELAWRWRNGTWRDQQVEGLENDRIIWAHKRACSVVEGSPRVLWDPFHGEGGRERFEVTMFGDIDLEVTKEMLIDDLLGAGEFSCFWGMPGCGKSVIVGDAAFHVASGLDWHGKPVKRGLVVFIAAERADLTKRRFAALRKRHGGASIPLAVVKGRLDLTSSPQDAKDIVEAVQAIEERTGEQCVWVIIDTVARTFGAGDENKQADMGAYVKACDLIRDDLSAHVTVIHHCSRSGEKPRGSIALDGAVDATFRVAKAGAVHTVAIDKENDAPGGGAIRFRMEGVELGTDSRGRVTTAPIAVPDTETEVAFSAEGVTVALKGKGSKASATLRQAIAEGAEHSPEGRPAVAVSELRRRLRDAFAKPGQKSASLDAIERRAFKGLIDSGEAERVGEWIMLPASATVAGECEQAEPF